MTPEDNRPATKQDLDRAVESIAAAIRPKSKPPKTAPRNSRGESKPTC